MRKKVGIILKSKI